MQTGDRKRIASIEDISLGGAAVFSVEPPVPSTPVLLAFPRQATKSGELIGISGRIVRQAGTGVVGIVFDPGQEQTVKSVLKLLPALRTAPRKKAGPAASRRRPASRQPAVKIRSSRTKRASKRR